MLDKPEQRLPCTAELGDLVKHQGNGFLDPTIRILLDPVADLHEADRGRNDQFAASSLLVAGRERTLAQKIQFILFEAALQAQQQSVIALARGVHGLLVDQHRVDDPAHLDKLLPVTAVAGEARNFPCSDCTDFAKADLGNHPVETGACHTSCG